MCGIFGIYNFKGKQPVLKEALEKGIGRLKHRGPDDRGFFVRDNIGLAHCRLSIIDLESGRQPIFNEDRSVSIVFNGEIYNYRQLRKELLDKGHIFSTKTDTEVLAHLYEEKGEKLLEDLNGIFAFCIFDAKRERLILARDRLGVKPLFYHYTKEGIVFSSEIKAFLTFEQFRHELNPESIHDYFSLGYILGPKTIFKEVHSLLPGHFLEVDNGRVTLKEYWDIKLGRYSKTDKNDILSQINRQVSASVDMQLVSDVPVGSFLSGGLDSSCVSYYMKQHLNGSQMKTFSVGFKEETYSELDYADLVSRHLRTSHEKLEVMPPDIECLKRIAWYNDEPFADTSSVPMYFVCGLAAKFVKVVLSGDGGDEGFGGYETYIADNLAKNYRKYCPSVLRKLAKKIVFSLPVSFNKISMDYKLRRFSEGAEFDSLKAHYWWRVVFTPEEIQRLLSDKLKYSIGKYDPLDTFRRYFDKTEGLPTFQRLNYVDFKTWLADDILRKVDRASMAHSLEARVPLLDHRLVELAVDIPDKWKIYKGKVTKYIFKKSMQGKLPKKIIWRKKRGFNSPVAHWVSKELSHSIKKYLNEEKFKKAGLFNMGFVNDLIDRHDRREEDNGFKIWAILNFTLWLDNFMIDDKTKVS